MIKTIETAVKYLEKFIPSDERKHPGKLGLMRIRKLAEILGNPHDFYKEIHIGGTSGKGSTATIISSILSEKLNVGLHTSPHLERINERIRVLGKGRRSIRDEAGGEISDQDFIELINEVRPAVEVMIKSKLGAPSYFEIVTVMAFLYFKKKGADFGVIEVGLGGRYDATNIIRPEVAVITNVSLDHTEVLGDTVEKIARDKAGIIKPGMKVVSGVKQQSVVEIVRKRSRDKRVKLSLLGRDFGYKTKTITDKGSYFDYTGGATYRDLFIPLLGVHQIENAALAVRAIEELGGFGEEEIRFGVREARIPGRLEIVGRDPLVVLDGAHNEAKMTALTAAIRDIWSDRSIVTVLAIKEGKRGEEMIEKIMRITDRIILTEYKLTADQGEIKSYKASLLQEILVKRNFLGKVNLISDAKKAVEQAIKNADSNDLVLVTGSIYLVGQVRAKFKLT